MAKKIYSYCLKADGRFLEAQSWRPWLDAVGRTRSEFADFIEYDPMSNETASMGVLASAATRAKLLATTEYICLKRDEDWRKKHRHGRLDLWVGDPKISRSWAFEAKQLRCRPGTRAATIEKAMALACHDAAAIPDHEGDRFFGLVVATVPDEGDCEALCDRLRDFHSQVDFAWECGGSYSSAFIFIRTAERMRKAKTSGGGKG